MSIRILSNSAKKVFPGKPLAMSLVEMMAALTILSLIMLMMLGITQQTGNAWQSSQAKIESFQGARTAFESMTRRISQTTLNNYWGYDDVSAPSRYLRKSELHFICGKSLLTNPQQITHSIFFQAPMGYTDTPSYDGLENLLNACGYFIQYNNDTSRLSFLSGLPDRYRYRLMQFSQPAQQLSVYQYVSGIEKNKWFTEPLSDTSLQTSVVRQIAENIVALVVLPKLSTGDELKAGAPLSSDYEYDTRNTASAHTVNQLPPLVEIVLVAIDESSALKLGNTSVAPDLGQSALFQQPSLLENDLNNLENVLAAKANNIVNNKTKLTYRIFRAQVPIRTAKWSAYD